jgi:hypothetical protein
MAQGLASNRMFIVGLMIFEHMDIDFNFFGRSFLGWNTKHGFPVMIFCFSPTPEAVGKAIVWAW